MCASLSGNVADKEIDVAAGLVVSPASCSRGSVDRPYHKLAAFAQWTRNHKIKRL